MVAAVAQEGAMAGGRGRTWGCGVGCGVGVGVGGRLDWVGIGIGEGLV